MSKKEKVTAETYAVKLPISLADKVNSLIEEKGWTKSYFIRKTIVAYFDTPTQSKSTGKKTSSA